MTYLVLVRTRLFIDYYWTVWLPNFTLRFEYYRFGTQIPWNWTYMARISVVRVIGDLDTLEVHRLAHPMSTRHDAIVVHDVLRHAACFAASSRAPLASGEFVPEKSMIDIPICSPHHYIYATSGMVSLRDQIPSKLNWNDLKCIEWSNNLVPSL